LRKIIQRVLILGVLAVAFAIGGIVASFRLMVADLPVLDSMEDYKPPTTSRVYDANGNLVARFYKERRTVVSLNRIPQPVRQAFLAAEDASFYKHGGIDYVAVLRAVITEIKYQFVGGTRSGGSTITQQTAKTFLLTPERTYKRKVKEMLLAKRIEERFDKDQILTLYLNQIYFGNGAYGIEEAARTYYGRAANALTLGQAAALASVPKAPSRINPFADPARVRERRRYVLEQMVKNGFIGQQDADQANEEPVRVVKEKGLYLDSAPYYAEEIRRRLVEKYGDDEVSQGGLTIYAALDGRLQVAANQALQSGLRAVDKRQGWRGPLVRLDADERKALLEGLASERERRFPKSEEPSKPEASLDGAVIWDLSHLDTEGVRRSLDASLRRVRTTRVKKDRIVGAVVKRVDNVAKKVVVNLGPTDGVMPFSTMRWARAFNPERKTTLPKKPGDVLKDGDVVLVRITGWAMADAEEKKDLAPWLEVALEQEPKVEGALVAVDPHSHRVLALAGGYRFSRSSFNRATQAKRQPGSAFKPFIYALAINERKATPATVITDAPKVFLDPWTKKKWKPENASGKFRGDIPLRTCLTHSVNTCSITLLEKVGVDSVHTLAERVGLLTEKTPFPKNLTLALGTPDIFALSLANAYSIFPAQGRYAPPILIEKVKKASGQVLQETHEKEKEVLDSGTAYVMTDLMKSVVEGGTGRRARALGRKVAGKTGTTNQARNAWFVGYTPDIVAAAYVGFDDNEPLGPSEYGGRAALPIWLSFMEEAVKEMPDRDFEAPAGVVHRIIDNKTGLLANTDGIELPEDLKTLDAKLLPANSRVEVFVSGTEPVQKVEEAPPPPLDLFEGGGLAP
jgi:penicillin-binding protein 1A